MKVFKLVKNTISYKSHLLQTENTPIGEITAGKCGKARLISRSQFLSVI